MSPSRKTVVPAVLFFSGLALVLAAFIGGMVTTSDTAPRVLAGLFITAFVPSALGMVLVGVGLAFGLARRRWVASLVASVLTFASLFGGVALTNTLIQRKLERERAAAEQGCAALRSSLERARGTLGGYPVDLEALPAAERTLCKGAAEHLVYSGASAAYLLRIDGSSTDIDGSWHFVGSDGVWGTVHEDLRGRLETAVREGVRLPEREHRGDSGRYAQLYGALLSSVAAAEAAAKAASEQDLGLSAP